MEVVETEAIPICPHCERSLDKVLVNCKVEVPGFFGRNYGRVYFCPHCQKVLGFADPH